MAERTEVNNLPAAALSSDNGLPPRRSKHAAPSRSMAAPDGSGPTAATPKAAKPTPGKLKPAKKRSWRETPAGRVLELLAYLIMLVLALVYFTGKGLFIYEGF